MYDKACFWSHAYQDSTKFLIQIQFLHLKKHKTYYKLSLKDYKWAYFRISSTRAKHLLCCVAKLPSLKLYIYLAPSSTFKKEMAPKVTHQFSKWNMRVWSDK